MRLAYSFPQSLVQRNIRYALVYIVLLGSCFSRHQPSLMKTRQSQILTPVRQRYLDSLPNGNRTHPVSPPPLCIRSRALHRQHAIAVVPEPPKSLEPLATPLAPTTLFPSAVVAPSAEVTMSGIYSPITCLSRYSLSGALKFRLQILWLTWR